MKTFTDEERCQISEDWLRNGNLKERARLERVAELHACSPKEVAEALGIEMPAENTKKKRKLQSYNQAVKDDCIKAVLLDGESQTAVGERFGIPQNTISAWVKAAKKKQQEFLDYPEPAEEPVSKCHAAPSSASLRSAPSPQGECFGGVDLKALEDAADGLLTFTDLFEEVGFLTAQQRRFIDELADQAHHYAAGIRWALERRQ